jgi:hypothetical protein
MNVEELFSKLWIQYTKKNIQANQIQSLLRQRGEVIVNDHIALRTFNLSSINLECLAKVFVKLGYVEKGSYEFKAKKLQAKHFELEGHPRVFISELKVEEFSPFLQDTVKSIVEHISGELSERDDFVTSGRSWPAVTYSTYQKLLEESEYAAWLAAFGYIANHFTISVNHLKTFKDLWELNQFIKDSGFTLNASGGEVKGGPDVYLAQSSTMAAETRVEFAESEHLIPSCFYEFAQRYEMEDGKFYSGFVAKSADKIFESTNVQ